MHKKTLISWKLEGRDKESGEYIHLYESPNLEVDTGKQEVLKWIGHLGTLAASGFTFLGFGASANTPNVTDTTLGGPTGYEYNRNGARYTITNWVISPENYTPDADSDADDYVYTQKMTGTCFIDGTVDQNAIPAGTPIQSYALFSTWVLPTTVGGTSGIMLNELVDTNIFNLKSGANANDLTVTITLRE